MKIKKDFSRPKDLKCNYCLWDILFEGVWNEMLGEREGGGEREKQRELIILPPILSCDTEDACHSRDDSIFRAFESQRSVMVVLIACRWTVEVPIGKGTVISFKEINTISFAVYVQVLPFHYGRTLGSWVKKRTTHLARDLCKFSRAHVLFSCEFSLHLLSLVFIATSILITPIDTKQAQNRVLATQSHTEVSISV